MKKQTMLVSTVSILVLIAGFFIVNANAIGLQSNITTGTSLCAVTESDYNTAVTKKAQLISQKSDVNSAIATKNREKDKIESQISSLKSKIKDLQKYIDGNCKRTSSACTKKAEDLKDAQGDLKNANSKLDTVKSAITTYQNQITNINKGIDAAQATIDKYAICGNTGAYNNPTINITYPVSNNLGGGNQTGTLTPPVLNGICSNETYMCLSGSMSQRPDIDGKKNWLCIGVNSGISVQCTKDVNNGGTTITLPVNNTQNPLLTFPPLQADPYCLGTRPSNSVVLQPGNVNTAARNWEYKVAIMGPIVYNTCTFTCPQGTTYNSTTSNCSNT